MIPSDPRLLPFHLTISYGFEAMVFHSFSIFPLKKIFDRIFFVGLSGIIAMILAIWVKEKAVYPLRRNGYTA